MSAFYLSSTGEKISLGPIVASGGEASIHTTTSRPDILAKLFHQTTKDIEDKLLAMLSTPPPCISLGGGYAELVWPLDIMRDADAGNACVGYIMRVVRNRMALDMIANPATCPQHINFSCKLRLAMNWTWMVTELHSAGYVVGDLHLGNTLGDQSGCISVIDTDSFQLTFQGRTFRSGVGKAEFIAPELFNKDLRTVHRTPDQDSFSLAIGIFQLLMDGNHPYQGKWRGVGRKPTLNERIRQGMWPYARPAPPDWEPRPLSPPFDLLHPLIQDAMTRCFQFGHSNPAMRPTASEWHQILLTVENDHAYLAKAGMFALKSPWRTRANIFKRYAVSLANKPKQWAQSLSLIKQRMSRVLRHKWIIGTTIVAGVLTLGTYFTNDCFSPNTQKQNHDSSLKCFSINQGNKKPTPRLWIELRDND